MQPLQAEMPTAQEMWGIIQQQQQMINELKEQINVLEQNVLDNTNEVEATSEAIEETFMASGAGQESATTIGGYGELHYNNNEQSDDEIDFHRFVLYIGHELTDNIRFFSELELEHALAGDAQPGEVELEQAFIEIDLNEFHHLRAGLDLIPVGLINYTHEPNRFYGVERPEVEKRIIPATWWEAGIAINGELAPGWNYDTFLHSGLNTTTNIRSGRQKVAQANADHPAFTARLRYTGTPGLEIGSSIQYQSDITAGVAGRKANDANLIAGHIDWKHSSGIALRALYARWDLSEQLSIAGDEEQYGHYIEPAYRFELSSLPGELGLFARWSDLDYGNTKQEEYTVLGLNYWPIDDIVFKFDWQAIDNNGRNSNRWNLGVGYEF